MAFFNNVFSPTKANAIPTKLHDGPTKWHYGISRMVKKIINSRLLVADNSMKCGRIMSIL